MNSILTVLTPALSFDLTVLATVKAELGITDTSQDTKLATMICQASELVASALNRVLAQESVKEQFRLDRCLNVITLKRHPVTVITSIVEDGGEPLVVATDYELEPDAGFLWRLSGDQLVDWSARKIVVTYTAGYALLDSLPHPIEKKAIDIVKRFWFAKGRDPIVKAEEVPGLMRQEFWVGSVGGMSLVDEISGDLSKYKDYVVV